MNQAELSLRGIQRIPRDVKQRIKDMRDKALTPFGIRLGQGVERCFAFPESNRERLDEVAEHMAAGDAVVMVGRHGSHLDGPAFAPISRYLYEKANSLHDGACAGFNMLVAKSLEKGKQGAAHSLFFTLFKPWLKRNHIDTTDVSRKVGDAQGDREKSAVSGRRIYESPFKRKAVIIFPEATTTGGARETMGMKRVEDTRFLDAMLAWQKRGLNVVLVGVGFKNSGKLYNSHDKDTFVSALRAVLSPNPQKVASIEIGHTVTFERILEEIRVHEDLPEGTDMRMEVAKNRSLFFDYYMKYYVAPLVDPSERGVYA